MQRFTKGNFELCELDLENSKLTTIIKILYQ